MNLQLLANRMANATLRSYTLRTLMGGLVGLVLLHSDRPCYAVIIDDFTDSANATSFSGSSTGWQKNLGTGPVGVLADLSLPLSTVTVSDSAATGAIGGQRDGRVFHSAGTGSVSAFVPTVANGTMQIMSGITDVGSVTYQYDAFSGYQAALNDPNGNLNVNLAGNPFLYVTLAFDPGVGSGETLDVGIFSNSGGGPQTLSGILVNSPYIAIPLAGFTNLGDVDRINFTFNLSGGSDLVIQEITTNIAPEPHTVAIWGLIATMASLFAWRFRRKAL